MYVDQIEANCRSIIKEYAWKLFYLENEMVIIFQQVH